MKAVSTSLSLDVVYTSSPCAFLGGSITGYESQHQLGLPASYVPLGGYHNHDVPSNKVAVSSRQGQTPSWFSPIMMYAQSVSVEEASLLANVDIHLPCNSFCNLCPKLLSATSGTGLTG